MPKPLQTKAMHPFYAGEHDPQVGGWGNARVSTVRYLSEGERLDYRLAVKDGKLLDAHGNLFDTADAVTVHPDGEGRAIFVMDGTGNIYASLLQKIGDFHHSSLVAGAPVAAAGEMVVAQGILKLVSNHSGHYTPSPSYVDQLLTVLEENGVDVRAVQRDYV